MWFTNEFLLYFDKYDTINNLAHLAWCLNRFLNVKAIVAAVNQEQALLGAFSVIVKTDGSFASLIFLQFYVSTFPNPELSPVSMGDKC